MCVCVLAVGFFPLPPKSQKNSGKYEEKMQSQLNYTKIYFIFIYVENIIVWSTLNEKHTRNWSISINVFPTLKIRCQLWKTIKNDQVRPNYDPNGLIFNNRQKDKSMVVSVHPVRREKPHSELNEEILVWRITNSAHWRKEGVACEK